MDVCVCVCVCACVCRKRLIISPTSLLFKRLVYRLRMTSQSKQQQQQQIEDFKQLIVTRLHPRIVT